MSGNSGAVGVSIDNEEYWAKIADFTPEMAGLAQRVSDLEDDVDTLSGNIDDVSDDVSALSDDVSGLANNLDALDDEVTAAQDDIAEIQEILENLPSAAAATKRIGPDSTIICIGNSLAKGTGAGGNGWPHYLIQHTGATEIAHAYQGGGDFIERANTDSTTTYPNMTYYEACQAIVASLTEEQRDSVDFIIFGGGINDWTTNNPLSPTSAQIRDAVTQVIDYLKPNFPNALICLFPIGATTNESQTIHYNGYTLNHQYSYISGWVRGASSRGCLTCAHTKHWFSGRKSLYGSATENDRVHFNNAGYNLMAYYMEAVINGWDGILKYDLTDTITYDEIVDAHTADAYQYTDPEHTGTAFKYPTLNITNDGGITRIQGWIHYTLPQDITSSYSPRLFTFDATFAPPQSAAYAVCYVHNAAGAGAPRGMALVRVTTSGGVYIYYNPQISVPLSGDIQHY